MSKKTFKKNFLLFSMIILFSSSIIQTTAYAVEKNISTSSTISNQTNTDTSKESKDTVSSNDNSNKISSNSSSITNTDINKDDKSDNDKNTGTVTEEKKEEEVIDYGWKTINDKIYYIVNNKILESTGWFTEKDVNPNITRKDKNYNTKYYLDKDFSVVIGWKQIENAWYYFDVQGIMQTGWISNNGLYYIDSSGEMKTGWNKIGMDTYHFNNYGQATVGKKLIDSKWYFFDEKGRLQKGFYDYRGKTYYSDDSGIMVTNQWITKNHHKFYIKSDSTIAIGNLFLNGLMEKFDEHGYLKGSDSSAKNDLYVNFLNVGNADCEFIKLPSGETVLIDTGDTTTTKTLIDFLKTQNLKTEFFESKNDGQVSVNNKTSNNTKIDNTKTNDIVKTIDSNTNNNVDTISTNKLTSTKLNNGKGVIDYVILTHPHSDHIGGMIELMKNFNIGKVITPKYFELKDYSPGVTSLDQSKIDIIKYDYQIYKTTMDALLKSGLPIVQAEPDSYIDSQHILQFLHLDKDYSKLESDPYYTEYNAFNDNSAIVYLNYHDFQSLFTGDIQWKAENDFFNRKALKDNTVDILKVPHHGNVGSSSYTFVGYVNPAIGIISRANERINTTNEPYDVLTTCGVNIYETSLTNGVSVYVTKDNWNIETK